MSNLIHLAIGSTTSLPGRVEANLRQINEFALRAADDGAHLLLTPEMSATGYGPHPEVLSASEVAGDGPIYNRLAHIAQTAGIVVCAGFAESVGDKKFIAHYAIYPDGNFIVQRKHYVTPSEYEVFSPYIPAIVDDEEFAHCEFAFQPFDVGGVCCAIAICADMGTKNLHGILDRHGVRVLLSPTGAGGTRDNRVTSQDLRTTAGREQYYSVLQTIFMPGHALMDCITYRRALAAVNLCGYDGYKFYHAGHGSIINPMGEVVGFFHGIPNLSA